MWTSPFHFWVKFTRWKGDPAFISNKNWNAGGNPGYVLATAGNGGFQWNFTDGTGRRDYDGPGGISDGNWHHLAVSYTRAGNAMSTSQGVQVDTQSIAPGVDTLDTGLPTNIGQDGTGTYTDNGGVGIDDGMVDDVAVWRRTLSAFEMQRIYQFGTNGVGGQRHSRSGRTGFQFLLPTRPMSGRTPDLRNDH